MNGAEAVHRHLNNQFYNSHTHIFQIIVVPTFKYTTCNMN